MFRYASLPQLPPDVQFPTDLESRIAFEPQRHRIGFDGAMSKAEFDRLYALSRDWDYQRAIEELFRVCTFAPPKPPETARHPRLWFAAGITAAAVVGATALACWRLF